MPIRRRELRPSALLLAGGERARAIPGGLQASWATPLPCRDGISEHVELTHAVLKGPIDVIQIVDDVAMQNVTFFNPGRQNVMSAPRMRGLVERIHAAGVPIRFHSDGYDAFVAEDYLAMIEAVH